ncbi:MAG: phosphoribosyl-ATP diphosphatase [Chitinivibrionales bacterium]|nr:phosphoribosyl-ATP diphosphatase [Chitinivibrionales bacterium]
MLIPSIDISNGCAVQLRNGRQQVLSQSNFDQLATTFDRVGPIAVIDLDAAMGQSSNQAIVARLLTQAQCRVGGGIRRVEQAVDLVSRGVAKVIIGSSLFTDSGINFAFIEELMTAVEPQRLVFALDSLDNRIVINGWRKALEFDLFDALSILDRYPVEFLCTFVENEGCKTGLNQEKIKRIRAMTQKPVTIAGGVATTADIAVASRLQVNVQVGMAIYTDAFTVEQAFIESLNWTNAHRSLLPTVVTDQRGQVLMVAYSTRQSLEKTFETGQMWYFSRSRNCLWHKGETSGNVQQLVRIRTDCDHDALLAEVVPAAASCHFGTYSCFGQKRYVFSDTYEKVVQRLAYPAAGSYTASLTKENVYDKVLEEAAELVEAQTDAEIEWEAADVLYFVTVLCAQAGVRLERVMAQLARRMKR